MRYTVKTIASFEKEAKRLAKKYSSLKSDLCQLVISLQEKPTQDASLGNGFYKIRLQITSKGRGKSGGARVITFVLIKDETVYLAAIYDKSDQISISDMELKWLSQMIAKSAK